MNTYTKAVFLLLASASANAESDAVGSNHSPNGASYCTYSPDNSCYKSGWPECCHANRSCPSQQPMCDKGGNGNSYCTYSPEYDCYSSGWPSCCREYGGADCPKQQPQCDANNRRPGSSYCTYSPNYNCYFDGWPSCCNSNNGANCPSQQPQCDVNNRQPGSSYCTYSPDYDCYLDGWPRCCTSNGGRDCPSQLPQCDTRNPVNPINECGLDEKCGDCKQAYCPDVNERKACKDRFCSLEELALFFPEDVVESDAASKPRPSLRMG